MQAAAPESNIAYPLHGHCYLNITSRCSLRCRFCPKHNRNWVVQNYDLRLHHEPDFDEVCGAMGDPTRYDEIVFCGLGEPTSRLSLLLELAGFIKSMGGSVRLNTDGQANLLYGRDVTPELAQVVDRISISLTAQDAKVYALHTRPRHDGAYDAMLDFTRCARTQGMDVTLTAIDGLPQVNIAACRLIADCLGVKFRRRVLGVVG